MTPRELAGALRPHLTPRRARWRRPAALVRALRLRRGETVAEIGCGPGYFTARLARAVGPAGHVFAVDPEPAVLDIMRRRLRGVRSHARAGTRGRSAAAARPLPHRSTHQRLPPHAARDGVPPPAGRLATPRRARDQC